MCEYSHAYNTGTTRTFGYITISLSEIGSKKQKQNNFLSQNFY